jgi:type I restriction enzyme S subunit
MNPAITVEQRRLKYAATINDESLTEATEPDYELQYIDIGNVDSYGTVHDVVAYKFEDAPSRARRIARHGDVIVSTVRTYLQAIAPIENPPENLIVSTGFAVIRPNGSLFDARFCKYAVREKHFLWEVESRSTGVSYPAINASDLADIRISLPDVKTQRLIADYLDRETARIDALVAEKEKMLALLEEKRAALISRAVTRGLDPTAPLKPSGLDWLGDIPAHWETRRLKYLTHEPLAYGANEAALEDNPDWPRFVRITDINEDGTLRDETFRSLSPEIAEPYLLERGDVLFARSGATVGKTFIYRPEWGEACFAGYLIRFRSAQELVLPDFVYFFSLSDIYWQQVESGTIQATIQNFSAEKYAELIVCLPPPSEQQAIVDFLINAELRTSTLLAEIRNSIERLKERRAALITAAVTGKIPVEEMQI